MSANSINMKMWIYYASPYASLVESMNRTYVFLLRFEAYLMDRLALRTSSRDWEINAHIGCILRE